MSAPALHQIFFQSRECSDACGNAPAEGAIANLSRRLYDTRSIIELIQRFDDRFTQAQLAVGSRLNPRGERAEL